MLLRDSVGSSSSTLGTSAVNHRHSRTIPSHCYQLAVVPYGQSGGEARPAILTWKLGVSVTTKEQLAETWVLHSCDNVDVSASLRGILHGQPLTGTRLRFQVNFDQTSGKGIQNTQRNTHSKYIQVHRRVKD